MLTLEEFYKALDIILHSKPFWYCASFSLTGILFSFPCVRHFLFNFFFEEIEEEEDEKH